MTARLRVWLSLGLVLGASLGVLLIWVDSAAAQTETTTTIGPPETTTTTVPASPPGPSSDPLGDPEATAWLARLLAFSLGVVVAR